MNILNNFGENALKYHEANCDPFNIKVAELLAAAGDEPIGRYTQQFPLQRLMTICRRALRRHMSEASPINLCCQSTSARTAHSSEGLRFVRAILV